MAHSYIYAKNSLTERSVAIPDGSLHLFIYFFNEIAVPQVNPSSSERKICEHYKIELLEVHTSYIDIQLQEVSEDKPLKDWYILMLAQLTLRIQEFGEYIDNQYLNQIPELLIGYTKSIVFTRPVEVSVLNNLINDIYWVLNEGECTPSGRYKWFENNL